MAPSERNWFRRWQQRGHAEMCIARQCHTSLESIQIDFSWIWIPEELYQTKKSSFRKPWSVLWASSSALPHCYPRRIYWIKCTLTLLWCVSADEAETQHTQCWSQLNSRFVTWSGARHVLFNALLQNGTTEYFCSGMWKRSDWGREDKTASCLLLLQLLYFSSKHIWFRSWYLRPK